MKKRALLLLMVSNSLIYANDMCGVFTNVLQTRYDSSKITMGGNATMYDTPRYKIDTGSIEDDPDNDKRLFDNPTGKNAKATGHYTKELDGIFSDWTLYGAHASKDVGGGDDHKVTEDGEVLPNDVNNSITQDSGKSFTWAPDDGNTTVEIKEFGNDDDGGIDSTFTLDKVDGKIVKIGQFYARGGNSMFGGSTTTHWRQKETPDALEIGELKIPDPNDFDGNLTAKKYIDINNTKFQSTGNDEINISAPIVRIGTQGGDGSADKTMDITQKDQIINIYADELNISSIILADSKAGDTEIHIHPYTSGKRVKVYIEYIQFEKDDDNQTIFMDSGDYYIHKIKFPTDDGDGNNILMKASNTDQKVNIILGNDFNLSAGYAINSDGLGSDNFGDNPSKNFRIFVDGEINLQKENITINALMYGTKSADITKQMYMRGAMSTENNITIDDDDSEFWWQDSITAGCGAEYQSTHFFDAWNNDDDHNISDRNITTKIVNKEINLTIASINDDNDETETKDGIDIRYALVDNNNSENNITPYYTFDATDDETIEGDFNVSIAEKNVSVQFKVCAEYNSSNETYKLHQYSDCDGECANDDENDHKECIRRFYSTDQFAIRPDKFVVDVPDNEIYKADNNMSTISISAIDAKANNSEDYNVSSDDLKLIATDKNSSANVPDVDYKFTFGNGSADIDHIKYAEVGEINLTLSEINGSEFAKIDEDDTPDNERLITPATSKYFRVIPDHFSITDINVTNFKGGKYTYLSNDLTMSGELNATITAENKSNNPTKNYSAGLYSKDLNISIPFSPDEIKNLSKVITQYGENNISDKNISFVFGEGNFSDAESNLSLKINFNRDSGKPVDDFNLTLKDINVTDEDDAKGSNSIDKNISFRYAKAVPENVSTYDDSSVETSVHFLYYHNNDWILNNEQNKTYGDVNLSYTKELSDDDVKLNEDDISSGTQNIDVNISTIKQRPYKLILHLGIAPWLWYSKSSKIYKVPSSSNTDCSTHPCANIILNKMSKGWAGIEANSSSKDVSKNTVNIGRDNNNSNRQFYHRLNW